MSKESPVKVAASLTETCYFINNFTHSGLILWGRPQQLEQHRAEVRLRVPLCSGIDRRGSGGAENPLCSFMKVSFELRLVSLISKIHFSIKNIRKSTKNGCPASEAWIGSWVSTQFTGCRNDIFKMNRSSDLSFIPTIIKYHLLHSL